MLVFLSFKASGLNVLNKTDTLILKEWLETWPLWRFVPEPPLPGGLRLGSPWSHLECLWVSQSLAEVGSRLCFQGISWILWWTPNPTARVRQGAPRWPCRVDVVESQPHPLADDRVALWALTSILVSSYAAAEWFGRWWLSRWLCVDGVEELGKGQDAGVSN